MLMQYTEDRIIFIYSIKHHLDVLTLWFQKEENNSDIVAEYGSHKVETKQNNNNKRILCARPLEGYVDFEH